MRRCAREPIETAVAATKLDIASVGIAISWSSASGRGASAAGNLNIVNLPRIRHSAFAVRGYRRCRRGLVRTAAKPLTNKGDSVKAVNGVLTPRVRRTI